MTLERFLNPLTIFFAFGFENGLIGSDVNHLDNPAIGRRFETKGSDSLIQCVIGSVIGVPLIGTAVQDNESASGHGIHLD
jgi:hypothetical protein